MVILSLAVIEVIVVLDSTNVTEDGQSIAITLNASRTDGGIFDQEFNVTLLVTAGTASKSISTL